MKELLKIANIRLITLLVSRLFLKTPTASSVLADARKGMILYLMSAMLVISAILLIYFQFYLLLVSFNVLPALASFIVLALVIISALVFRTVAKDYLRKAKAIKEHSEFLHKAKSIDKKAEAIVRAFFQGMFEE